MLSHDAEHTSQPFKPYSKEKLEDLAENIRQNGVISPITLRTSPFEPNRYQVLVGHNRVEASKLAGKKTIPANIIQASDEEAKLILVDSNLYQRDHLLHSEKAFAYKMRLDTIKQQGKRVDLTSTQVAGKLESADQLGHQSGESGDTIRRYIRLTHLLPPLLDMVDQEDVPFTAGVSISFLSPDAQTLLLHIMYQALEQLGFRQGNIIDPGCGIGNFMIKCAGHSEKLKRTWKMPTQKKI